MTNYGQDKLMIKITPDSTVLIALKSAFPTPANSAEKALNKYILVIENMLNEAILRGRDGFDSKLNLYSISLHELANKGPQIGPEKIRIHKWLKQNDYMLVKSVELGSGITGNISRVKLTELIQSKDIDDRLNPQEAFEKTHPNFNNLTQQEIDIDYDKTEVNIDSLNTYIDSIAPQGIEPRKNKLRIAFHQARRIAAVATYKNGVYYQKRKLSFFGRIYYEGLSVQNVNKTLRVAMLGNGYEYDIRSSVVSWKLGFAQAYINAHEPNNTIDKVFPTCEEYSVNKSILINRIKRNVFKYSKKDDKDESRSIKDALTALNFGARVSGNSYTDKQGKNHKQAIAGILSNKVECNLFLHCPIVTAFIDEQKKLDNFILDFVKNTKPELLKLVNPKNNKVLNKKSLLAFMYQHAETETMEIVRDMVMQNNLSILGNIHDAIILKKKLSHSLKKKIESAMKLATNNPYWFLVEKKLKPGS